jgi:hypothetical protein
MSCRKEQVLGDNSFSDAYLAVTPPPARTSAAAPVGGVGRGAALCASNEQALCGPATTSARRSDFSGNLRVGLRSAACLWSGCAGRHATGAPKRPKGPLRIGGTSWRSQEKLSGC